MPPKAKNVYLRVAQYDLHRLEEFCFAFSREVVAAKIESCAAVLRRYRRNHPEAVAIEQIAPLDAQATAAAGAASLESLRGIEGAAAARYFRLLPALVPPDFAFEGRNRRPPRDPCNALLSFGYVLVATEIQALLDAMGYDPPSASTTSSTTGGHRSPSTCWRSFALLWSTASAPAS